MDFVLNCCRIIFLHLLMMTWKFSNFFLCLFFCIKNMHIWKDFHFEKYNIESKEASIHEYFLQAMLSY